MRPFAAVAGLAAVAVSVVFAILTVQPPGPQTDPAAPGPSAARAFTDVERLGARPHVVGSAANDAVRGYLVDTLRGIGFAPRVEDTIGVNKGSLSGGTAAAARVRNIVTLVPGTAAVPAAGRVFVVAHYDSVQSGPGANDDGAGVASLLETARQLKAHPPRNDVVLLATEGEEACLCGAEAFVAADPLAADGGVVLNVEARGTSGPAIMFETTAGNANVVRTFAAAAPHPVATSFAVEVYRILPNDTDFSPFRDAGRFVGLNSAYIDGSAAYHGPQDTPGRMNLGSLQMHLDNTTALVAAFGAADLAQVRAYSGDATYFPVFGWLLRYPGQLVWPLAILAVVAVAAAVLVARRRGRTSVPRFLAGTAAALVPLVVAPLLAQLGWRLLVALRPGMAAMDDPWHPSLYRAAVVCLVAAVVTAWYCLLRTRIGGVGLALGGLVWLALLGVGLAALAPGGSYLTAVPALAGGLALLFLGREGGPSGGRAGAQDVEADGAQGVGRGVGQDVGWGVAEQVARVLAAVVAVIVLVPTAVLFFPALGLTVAAVPAVVLVLLGLALVPVLEWLPHTRWTRLLPVVPLVVALVLGGIGQARNVFTAADPAPSQLMYLLDADVGTARWVSAESTPDPWTAQYVGGREQLDGIPGFEGEYATGPAQVAALPPAAVRAQTTGTTVTVRVTPQRADRLVALRSEGATVRSATVSAGPTTGTPVPVRDGRLDLLFHAPPPEGIELRLELSAPGPLQLRVTDGSDGLTGLPGFSPRPADVGVAGSHTSELVAVTATHRIA
ncbi:M20/M25/M40 family metallo-hydrolase [Pseudonocardia ailaonensis]|uniref:M20/M25/M40 family metallo-hydrolase n=1 Tax=Pseudonocardia ailaonensis TaxID=367279 RepID=UPI0031DBA242